MQWPEQTYSTTIGNQTNKNSDKQRKPTKKRKVLSRRRHLLRSSLRDTLYPWTGLPFKSVNVVLTRVVCLAIEEEQFYSFRARGD